MNILVSLDQEPQPGTLKIFDLKEGTYILQLTVTDTAGQSSSDNVSVTVIPMVATSLGERTVEVIVLQQHDICQSL